MLCLCSFRKRFCVFIFGVESIIVILVSYVGIVEFFVVVMFVKLLNLVICGSY